MGVGASIRRYKGGKRPMKYFQEDMWPLVEDMFDKLGINFNNGFVLFECFSNIDVDEGGTCDLDECFGYLGGARTKFNERWFDLKGNTDSKEGLEFMPFSIALWNFCTMTPSQVARQLWEIFDTNNSGELQKPHVEAMFRMVYDLDHMDDKVLAIINAFPFEPKTENISKLGFLQRIKRDKRLIKPALSFQNRVRKKLGGNDMWHPLAEYRKRTFIMYDSTAQSMDIALAQIVAAKNQNKRMDPADVRFQQEKAKLKRELEDAERELRIKERAEAEAKRRQEMLAEDRPMKMAWRSLDGKIEAFSEHVFSLGDEDERKNARDELFALFDNAREETYKYWSKRDAKEMSTMDGTDDDKQARLEDYIKTSKGNHDFRSLVLERVLQILLDTYPSKPRMNPKETTRLSAIGDAMDHLQRLLKCRNKQRDEYIRKQENYAKLVEEKVEIDAKVDPDLAYKCEEHSLTSGNNTAKKYAQRKDWTKAEEAVRKELAERLHGDAVQAMEWEMERSSEERRREAVIKEFRIISDFGSRETMWELVFDPDHMRNVYVNRSTFDVLHEKTAICHVCDSIFAQADVKCAQCDAARSAKNLKLYRPLGFKDITID